MPTLRTAVLQTGTALLGEGDECNPKVTEAIAASIFCIYRGDSIVAAFVFSLKHVSTYR